jgi:hypothetical protein
MDAERPAIDAAMNRLLTAMGYAIRRQPGEHADGKWIGRFASALGGGATLEADVNYMARQPLFGVDRLNFVALADVQAKGISVLNLREVVASKLVALFDRTAARDLFDARRILDIPGLDWTHIKAAMLAYGASGRRDGRLASIGDIGGDPKEVRQKLAICLPQNAFDAAGGVEAWIAQAVEACRTRLAPLFALSPEETAFLDGVLDRGEIDASGLAVDPDIQAGIAAMPMLQWKAQNVRLHKRGG